MDATTRAVAKNLKLPTPAPPKPAAGEKQDGDPDLTARVLRQVGSGQLDEERLLPNEEKRGNDIAKKLDRMADGKGWHVFASANAHTAINGRAPQRRNAEIALVTEAIRWRKEVARYRPSRTGEFDALLGRAIDNPTEPTRDS